MAKSKFKSKVRPLTVEESKAATDRLDKAIKEFTGDLQVLEQALGMYLIGRHFGWRPLVLIHNKRTIKKYEEILGIDIRSEFPEVGPDAERSLGYRVAKQMSNFWKAVSGEVAIEGRREIA
jgi:hypothetical protein